jgi:hypothetical protein
VPAPPPTAETHKSNKHEKVKGKGDNAREDQNAQTPLIHLPFSSLFLLYRFYVRVCSTKGACRIISAKHPDAARFAS